jgi:predicted pyridoxine 5'-phosphate oxidase superfamily flavin-nucleotide-binding protein
MELDDRQWVQIRKIFQDAFNSSFHFSIATVNKDGSPHVTPIGSLMLRDDRTGFYFEEYVTNLSRNVQHNKRVCVMAVNSSKWRLLKSFFFGKFLAPPGVRLMGTVTDRREATPQELELFQKRVKNYRMFKGHKKLWSRLRHVRDIHFDSYEPIRIGALTRGL